MAVSRLAPQPVAFYAGVSFLANAKHAHEVDRDALTAIGLLSAFRLIDRMIVGQPSQLG
jgi:hypothetical protein